MAKVPVTVLEQNTTTNPTVTLFIPCYVDQLAPAVPAALLTLLARLGVAWQLPPGQTCCGQLAYNAGDRPGAAKLLQHFAAVFAGTGPIVCPGPSCVRMVRRHAVDLLPTPEARRSLAAVSDRLVDLAEYLLARTPFPFSLAWHGRVFVHQSCAARELGLLPTLQELLSQIKGVELCTLPAAFSCCGFGGLFALKQKELSQIIGWRYLQAVAATAATVVVSPDVGCLLHLQALAQVQNLPLRFLHVAQFLATAMGPSS